MNTEEPGTPVLVEGPTDREVLSIINDIDFGFKFNIRDNGGKEEVLENATTLAQYIQRFGILIDVDDRSPEETRQQMVNKLEGNFKNVERRSESEVIVENRTLIVLGCTGLHDDEDLNTLGIYRNAIEDHLLKILLSSDETVRRISESNIETSDQLLTALQENQDHIEEYTDNISRSKLLYRLSSILLRYDGNVDSFSHTLLMCSDIDMKSHKSTRDIVSFLESVGPS